MLKIIIGEVVDEKEVRDSWRVRENTLRGGW